MRMEWGNGDEDGNWDGVRNGNVTGTGMGTGITLNHYFVLLYVPHVCMSHIIYAPCKRHGPHEYVAIEKSTLQK
jgi:hypothetical protein